MRRKGELGKKALIVVLTCLLTGLSILPVYGTQLDELRKKQQSSIQEISQYKKLIKSQKNQLYSLANEIEKLDVSIGAIEDDIKGLHEQLAAAQNKVADAQVKLKKSEAALQKRNEIFANRLVEIYENGDVSFLEVLMSSTDITDFLVRFELFSKLAEQDMTTLKAIERERANIVAYQNVLIEEKNKIAALKQQAEVEQQKLEERKDVKEELQAKIESDKAEAEKALAEEEKASREVAQKIREIQARLRASRYSGGSQQNNFTYSGGRLAWPLPGYSRISSDYGYRIHPVLKNRKKHTGIDIPAPTGAKVIAAEDGTVIFVGRLGAYGNAVIIQHTDSLTTMYPHLSAYIVSEGEKVKRGQQVGRVGSTGLSTGPHLHFEVRVNGDDVNPWSYLR
ncbi:peptidoglycan DD-metalloendopeptidase family protein [Bacillota bacterium LX-D]|nr:peptidoglycan DD-metalloendopeptidase family protein [Bacillota bacterium LX-D]